jgi:hypothetical protein
MRTRNLDIVVRQGAKYLCWDSFASAWFWGPKRLSEKFPWNVGKCVRATELAGRFGGEVRYALAAPGEGTITEERR